MSGGVNKTRELRVEGLRGLAALMVVYTHLFAPFKDVDPLFAPSRWFWMLEAGQGAVLFFFVLSGYVIGITNASPAAPGAVASYTWRRMIRLVPLYILAVGLSVLVRPMDTPGTIIGNLLFLQNALPYGSLHVSLLSSNTNLWSLNYEVLYYILFPFVWLTGGRSWAWVAGAALLGIAAWALPVSGALVACYAAGWTFWLAGYCLAKAPRITNETAARLPWPSLMLLWIVTWHVKPFWFFARRFGFLPEDAAWMNFTYYDFLPCCLALLLVASRRDVRAQSGLILTALAIPLGFLIWRTSRGRLFADGNAIDDLLCLSALALWWWRPPSNALARFAPIGAISYGLYIFQRPVQWFIRDASWLPAGTAATFSLRFILIAAFTLTVAWFTEARLQIWIRHRFTKLQASRAG
jgi:peptidoglycan/LPS O-acetylase OafA/YrhL